MQYLKTVTVASAAVLVLAGCGSQVAGQAAPTAVSSAPPATNTAPTSSAAPAGNGLTPTGTTLAVGETATVQYETKSQSKQSTKLEVTAVSVKKGAISDLKDFTLDAQTKASEPYYVTMTFKNAGPETMEPTGIFGLINPHNADGDKLGKLNLIGKFKRCEGTPPKTLAVGASFTECDVFVAPVGQAVASVVFGFYLDSTSTEITWKAG